MKKQYKSGELVNYEGRTAVKIGENKYLNFFGIGFNHEDALKIANHFCKKVIDSTQAAN